MANFTQFPESLLAIANSVQAQTHYLVLLEDPSLTSLQISVSGSTVTVPSGHPFANGSRVLVSSTGTLPAPLANATVYRAISVGATSLQLSTEADYNYAAKTGTAIAFTSAGTGTISIAGAQFTAADHFTAIVKHEAEYGGISARPTVTLTTPSITRESGVLVTSFASASITIDPPSSQIQFRSAAIIRGGSATIGNSGGVITALYDHETTVTIPVGSPNPATLIFNKVSF